MLGCAPACRLSIDAMAPNDVQAANIANSPARFPVMFLAKLELSSFLMQPKPVRPAPTAPRHAPRVDPSWDQHNKKYDNDIRFGFWAADQLKILIFLGFTLCPDRIAALQQIRFQCRGIHLPAKFAIRGAFIGVRGAALRTVATGALNQKRLTNFPKRAKGLSRTTSSQYGLSAFPKERYCSWIEETIRQQSRFPSNGRKPAGRPALSSGGVDE